MHTHRLVGATRIDGKRHRRCTVRPRPHQMVGAVPALSGLTSMMRVERNRFCREARCAEGKGKSADRLDGCENAYDIRLSANPKLLQDNEQLPAHGRKLHMPFVCKHLE